MTLENGLSSDEGQLLVKLKHSGSLWSPRMPLAIDLKNHVMRNRNPIFNRVDNEQGSNRGQFFKIGVGCSLLVH